jgi:multidrug efflux pump subunit AcrA (membrane-fusion protein)
MKTRSLLIIAIGALVVGTSVLMLYPSRPAPTIRVTGPLSTNDVSEITQLVLHERAPVLPGQFAPKNSVALRRRLRERVAGQIRSIASGDGQTANVNFGDRWNPKIGYDYDLERTTNGWKVIGVGWRGPANQ